MIASAAAEATQPPRSGLRAMDPMRDLKPVTDLIAGAFGAESDERGRAAIREMRWMARLSPLVWWWSQTDPAFAESLTGFVWEEPAPPGRRTQIVGNVSLNRAPGDRQQWIVCNVVVKDGYRGRGIGRKLTKAAIAEARDLGATGVLLQVYEDNLPALHLYTDLGFGEVAGETALRLASVAPVPVLDAPGYSVRPWRPADGQRLVELARLATATELQWLRPLRAERYQPSAWTRLGEKIGGLAGGRLLCRLTALAQERPVATVTIAAASWQGEHTLELLVDPDHAGRVGRALVSRALQMLAATPPRPVRAIVGKDQVAAMDLLCSYGFQKERTLLTLRKDVA